MPDPRREERAAAIRRRRRGLIAGLGAVALLVVLAVVWAARPADTAPPANYASSNAVDEAAANAAKNAGAAAKAAEEIEQRAWATGQYASEVPPADGVSAGTPAKGLVALTFDDGPGPASYDVLALLRKWKMHGTFFVLGSKAAADPAVLKKMVEEGHVVGNHSWDHASLPTLKPAALAEQMDRTSAAITAATGQRTTIMRPPFGDFSAETNQWMRKHGMLPILWNVDSNDWALQDPKSVAANILDAPNFGPGAIILLHDGGADRSMTINALPAILDGLKARGLRSVTIPELLRQGKPQIITPGTFAPSKYAEAAG